MDNAIQEVTQKALSVPEQAKAIIITDNETYEVGANILLVIKDLRKKIDATFDPIIKKADDAHKEAVAQKKKVDAPLVEAEGYLKPQMANYLIEEEKRRKKEEERLRAEALKKEEEERLAFASELEASGAKEEAETILEEPIYVPPVSLPKTTPKVSGIALKQNWDFEIVNESQIPQQYLKPDLVKIGQIVRALKDRHGIPGVRAFPVAGISAGRRQ